MSAFANKTVLTGIKPTGTPHLGNYVGAMRPVIDMSHQADSSFVFIADLHALNAVRDPKEIRESTYEVAASLLALGLDAEKTVFFRQSDIPEIYALAQLLNNVTPKGLMNRAHAYKATVDKNNELDKDPDDGVNMGLFTYPVLMTADILLYHADVVPVGSDQKQHIEFARDIAGSFHALYGDGVFKIPEPVIQDTAHTIPGLDGRKMSKSYNNTIPLFAAPKAQRKLIMKIVTDSKLPSAPKNPDDSTIFELYQCFADIEQVREMREKFEKGGMGYGDAKKRLAEAVGAHLATPREKYDALMNNTAEIDVVLDAGAEKARVVASKNLAAVKKAMLGR